jgi:putative DNA primase/helicase
VNTKIQTDTRVEEKAPYRKATRKAPPGSIEQQIQISKFMRDDKGSLFVQLKFNSDCQEVLHLMPLTDIGTEKQKIFADLIRAGGRVITAKAQNTLLAEIESSIPDTIPRTVATKIGWWNGRYVLPHQVVPEDESDIAIYLSNISSEALDKYAKRGKLNHAKTLMEYSKGNSRFILAVCLAFAGPVIGLMDLPPVAFQFFGAPASGKTSLGAIVSSIWGWNHRNGNLGFGETWNTTQNNLEQLGPAHNHNLLFLDETRVSPSFQNSPASAVLNAVMSLDSSQGKGRLNQPERAYWRTAILSTSNLSLDEMPKPAGFTFDDAYRDRLIDVGLPSAGSVFENLHGFPNAGEFIGYLRTLASENCGLLGKSFASRLALRHRKDPLWIKKYLADRRAHYLAIARNERNRTRARVLEKFALLYGVGCLAARFKFVSWSMADVQNAVYKCEVAHFDHVNSYRLKTNSAAILCNYIKDNQALFKRLKPATTVVGKEYREATGLLEDVNGNRILYLRPDTFDSLFTNSVERKRAKRDLRCQGILKCDASPSSPRFVVKKTIGKPLGRPPIRLYFVKIDLATLMSKVV